MTPSPPLDLDLLASAATVHRLVDQFRLRQERDGAIADPNSSDVGLLQAILVAAADVLSPLGQYRQIASFLDDVTSWIAVGLDTTPNFWATRDTFAPPADGGLSFFIGPVLAANSAPPVGYRLESFLGQRRDPRAQARLSEIFPHPTNKCQSMLLLSGSSGFARGNCLSFESAEIPGSHHSSTQRFALSFFSKFRHIHEIQAVAPAQRIMQDECVPRASAGLLPDTCYEARSTWGYLHNHYRHRGPWLRDSNVELGKDWFVGVLDHLKADAKTAVTANDDERVPYRKQQIDMILLERLIRCPRTRSAARDLDAGAGVLLYSWFRERDCIRPTESGLSFDRARAIDAMRDYVDEVEELERRVSSPDEYRAEARDLVRRYLPAGPGEDRFSFTSDHKVLLQRRIPNEDSQLVFGGGAL